MASLSLLSLKSNKQKLILKKNFSQFVALFLNFAGDRLARPANVQLIPSALTFAAMLAATLATGKDAERVGRFLDDHREIAFLTPKCGF